MLKPPTVYDVAAHAGVSIATVSRVLRRPDDVKGETRERVLDSVRTLGYVPSASARGLAARRTGVLGVYFPEFVAVADLAETDPVSGVVVIERDIPPAPVTASNLYFDEVLRGCEVEAWRSGFSLQVRVGRGEDLEATLSELAGRVDGLAAIATNVPQELLERVARRIPVVVVAGDGKAGSLGHVGVRNADGMRVLTEHLVCDLGVRDLAYLDGPPDSADARERSAGFEAAVAGCGLDPSAVRRLPGAFLRQDGVAAAQQLLADRLPRAIVCANDQMAIGVLEKLADAGVDVPGRVVVTGFDGLDAGRVSAPPLTTVRQPMTDVGRVAMRLLRERVADPQRMPRSVELPVTILLRASTEPA